MATAGALPMGVGLLLLRKWAAVLLSVGSICAGLWVIIGSIIYAPSPWLFANFLAALPFFVPAVASYFFRHKLVWKG